MKKRSALEEMSKNALLDMAKEISLHGRSRMTKAELVQALLAQSPPPKASRKPVRKPDKKKRESLLPQAVSFDMHGRTGSGPDSFQQEVERGRFDLGMEEPSLAESLSLTEDLPHGYGDDRIVLLVRDPYWIHSYWEIQQGTIERVLEENGLSGQHAQKVLRVYIGSETEYYDINVEGLINTWYINSGRPDTDFFVDIGIGVQDRFIALARSNRVRTPLAGMSSVIDDRWMSLEEEARTIYALSGGFRMGEGSLGLQEMMERRLLAEISSGAISSFFGSGQIRERPRGFWYNLDAELIVYGATEPDASVTLQGRPIQLRPDGTFTARFALPDGNQEIPVTFVSSDEVDRVTVEPKVSRRTDRY